MLPPDAAGPEQRLPSCAHLRLALKFLDPLQISGLVSIPFSVSYSTRALRVSMFE